MVHRCFALKPYSDFHHEDTTSALTMDIVDELRLKSLECLLALEAISQEADFYFTDLTSSILATPRPIRGPTDREHRAPRHQTSHP